MIKSDKEGAKSDKQEKPPIRINKTEEKIKKRGGIKRKAEDETEKSETGQMGVKVKIREIKQNNCRGQNPGMEQRHWSIGETSKQALDAVVSCTII